MTFADPILSVLNSTEMLSYLKAVDDFIWGPHLLMLLVGTGVFFTFCLGFGFIKIKRLPLALKYLFGRKDKETG